jgi:hypothetical protein
MPAKYAEVTRLVRVLILDTPPPSPGTPAAAGEFSARSLDLTED